MKKISIITTKTLLVLVTILYLHLPALSQTRIIDMHIHSYTESDFGEREPAGDHYGVKGSPNAEAHRNATFEAFKTFNIVKAVVSGNPESVEEWAEQDEDNRVIPGGHIHGRPKPGLPWAIPI